MSESNTKTVLQFIDAMSNGDARMADACLAPDAVAVTKGTSALTGTSDRETIVSMVGAIKSFVPTGLGAKILTVTSQGDRVVVEFEGNAVSAEGRPYCNQYCMVFTMVDGKIAQSNEYFCTKLAEDVLWPLVQAAGIRADTAGSTK